MRGKKIREFAQEHFGITEKEFWNRMLNKKCLKCGKPLKQLSEYIYAWECGCAPKTARLSIG